MSRESAVEYFRTLGSTLRESPDLAVRRDFMQAERQSAEFLNAFSILRAQTWKNRFEDQRKTDNAEAKPLSREQEVIEWARNTFDEFSQMPNTNGTERRRISSYVKKTATVLVAEPDRVDLAAPVWKNTASDDENHFYASVKDMAEQEMKDGWRKVPPEHLATLVKVYSHNEQVGDFAEGMLAGYFRGPQNVSGKIEAWYNFVLGGLDLVADPKARDSVAHIGLFQTPIIPMNGSFYADILVAKATTLSNEHDARRVFNANMALSDLIEISTMDIAYYETQVGESIHVIDIEAKARRAYAREKKVLGEEEATRRKDDLVDFMSRRMNVQTSSTEDNDLWPNRVVFDPDDPIRKKILSRVSSRSAIERLSRLAFIPGFKRLGYDQIERSSLVLGDGARLELFWPSELVLSSRRQLIEGIDFDEAYAGLHQAEGFNSLVGTPMYWGDLEVNGMPIKYVLRTPSQFERNSSPINGLAEIGLPEPKIEGTDDLEAYNEQLAARILPTQTRYVESWGFRVPIDSKKLKDLGYRAITYRKDPTAPTEKDIEIDVAGLKYTIDLDRYLNFDLKGQSIEDPYFANKLRYLLLSVLEPYMCTPEEEVGKKGKIVIGNEIVKRIGHRRFLPEGQGFRPRAVGLLLTEQGEDLATVSEARKPLAIERFGTVRNTTYVRRVLRSEEEIETPEIAIPTAHLF